MPGPWQIVAQRDIPGPRSKRRVTEWELHPSAPCTVTEAIYRPDVWETRVEERGATTQVFLARRRHEEIAAGSGGSLTRRCAEPAGDAGAATERMP